MKLMLFFPIATIKHCQQIRYKFNVVQVQHTEYILDLTRRSNKICTYILVVAASFAVNFSVLSETLVIMEIFHFQPYRPESSDLEYADVDYKYGPINYKAASIYAAMKRNKNNNRMEEVNKPNDDLL
jgi:hypothetical protein